MNDVAEANSIDLDYVFTTQTSATVKLKASNGECSSEAAQTITSFNQGPLWSLVKGDQHLVLFFFKYSYRFCVTFVTNLDLHKVLNATFDTLVQSNSRA